MSDEQPQPSLRLKPRSAPATTPPPDAAASVPDSAVQPPDATPASEASAALNDPMRLRLKPKTPPPEGSPADTSGVTFATPQPFATAPTPAAEETPAPAPVDPAPPLPPIAEYVPPPQPVAPAVPYVPTLGNLNETPRTPGRSEKAQHAYKADKWLAAVVIFVLVLAGAIYGVRFLMKANPKQKSAARASASTESKPVSTEQTPAASGQSRLVEKPTSSAGKAVAKVRDLVASREKFDKEQGVEHVLADTPDAVPANPSANVVSIEQPAKPEPAPEPEPELPPMPPSDAFRQFVISMRVNGVFQGENARAMINGKMYQLGDIVDTRLGITFFKIDVENKQLIFRDESTAIMPRRY